MKHKSKEIFGNFGKNDEVCINTFEVSTMAENWLVNNNDSIKGLYQLFDKKLDILYPGLDKNNFLSQFLSVYQKEFEFPKERKSTFYFYRKKGNEEIGCRITSHYMRVAEMEVVYSSNAKTIFIEEFLNFVTEYMLDLRPDCSNIIVMVRESEEEKQEILNKSGFFFVGILHSATIKFENVFIFESWIQRRK